MKTNETRDIGENHSDGNLRFPWKRIIAITLIALVAGFFLWRNLASRPTVRFLDSSAVEVSYIETPGLPQRGCPTIEATLNGVKGLFLVDTGANGPILTGRGVRDCGIDLSNAPSDTAFQMGGAKTGMKVVSGLTLEIKETGGAGVLTVRWAHVLANAADSPWMGVIDYKTLQRLNAVIDTKAKTITFSR